MNIREYEVKVQLPAELKPLETMAYNLWFAWNSPATALYKNINEKLWEESEHNPLAIISALTMDDCKRLIDDDVFMASLNDVYASVLVNYKAEAQLCALMLLQISKAHPCTSKLFVHVVQGDRQMSKKNPLTHNLVI